MLDTHTDMSLRRALIPVDMPVKVEFMPTHLVFSERDMTTYEVKLRKGSPKRNLREQ
jgi:hypothetical protein